MTGDYQQCKESSIKVHITTVSTTSCISICIHLYSGDLDMEIRSNHND